MTDTVPARRKLLALLLDRMDRDALLPAERPLLRALVTAEQDDAPAPATGPVITLHDEATSAAVRPLLDDLDAMRRRAEQAEGVLKFAKELLARRTTTLRRRAERAERLLDSARKARLCGDCRINLDGAIEDASETPDEEQPDTRLQAVTDALTAEHHRRARQQIVASPEEHSAAMAAVALDTIDGRHWRGTDGDDIGAAYMDAQAALARVRRFARALAAEPHPAHDHVCPDDIRAGILSALRPPSPTPDDTPTTADDAQAAADRAALDDAIVDDIARRAVEGDSTGQKLGILAGNQAPTPLVNINDARRRAGFGPAPAPITTVTDWATTIDEQCPARYTGDSPHLTDAPGLAVDYRCGRRGHGLDSDHAMRQGGDVVFRWTDAIAIYPTTSDAPSSRCTATITGMDHVNPDRIIRCEKPAGHYDFDYRPAPEVDALSTGGWHSSDGGKRVWADHAHGATPATDAPSEPQP